MSRNKSQHPKVFISYSWDSAEHKNSVLDLADQLRIHGIDCNIDQFEVSPTEGWLNWMLNQIEESDFVLLVCTEKYYRRYRGKEKLGQGKGAVWEGAIISQLIYDQQSNNRFIPVIFDPQAGNYIPSELRKHTWYLLNRFNFNLEESGYESLYRHLTNQSRKKVPLGPTVPLPRRPHYRIYPPREEEKGNPLENLYDQYNQGKKYYQDKNWFEAYRKFDKILSFQPGDRDFRQRVEQRLGQTQQQIAKEKKISIGIIVASWLVSVWLSTLLPVESIGVFGGFVSGIIVWWVSQWTKQLKPSLKILKLFLFIFTGVFLEYIFWQVVEDFPFLIKYFFVILIGSAISIAVLFWQINNRLIGK